MLGLQTDFRPPCDYSDAGWRFYTSSNERKKKRKEKEESVEKKQEKIRIYIYIEQDKRERGPRLASGTYPRSKSVGYPSSGSLLAPPLAVPRLVYQRPVYNISPALSAARCLLPDRLRR